MSIDASIRNDPLWEFVLSFQLPAGAPPADQCLDALYEAGCDDATMGVGRPGVIAADFSRRAPSARDAVTSGIRDISQALPDATLIEIAPDLVNLADIADLVGCSRQNLRKYAAGEVVTVSIPFPEPIVTANPSLWRLAEVATWLRAHTSLTVSDDLLELVQVTAETGLAIQQRRWEAVQRAKWQPKVVALA